MLNRTDLAIRSAAAILAEEIANLLAERESFFRSMAADAKHDTTSDGEADYRPLEIENAERSRTLALALNHLMPLPVDETRREAQAAAVVSHRGAESDRGRGVE